MPVTPVTLDVPLSPTHEHPHGYCGEMVSMTFIKPFVFTHADHQQETFPPRTLSVPVEVATHWYAMAHTDTPPEAMPAPGTPAYAEARRKELMATTDRRFAQQQLDMATAAQVNRQAMEQTLRNEMTDKLKAELMVSMQAEFDKKLAAAVAATKAEMTPAPEAPAADKAKAAK